MTAVWLATALAVPTALAAQAAAQAAAPAPDSALAAGVTTLADRYAAALIELFPEQAELSGVAQAPHDRLSDNSLTGVGRWQRLEDSLAAALAPVNPSRLGGSPAWITYGYLKAALDGGRATRVCRSELWPTSQAFGWQTTAAQLATVQPVGTPELRASALARWNLLPRYVRTEIANLREGLRLGYVAPKSVVRSVIEQLDVLIASEPDSLPFMDPARRDSTPEFVAAWRVIATDSVRTVAEEYRGFLQRVYLPRARLADPVTANPHGRDCYRALLRQATSIDRDPELLWRQVLTTVARDSAALVHLGAEVYGAPPSSRPDIRWLRHRLETDRLNVLPTADSIRAFSEAAMRRARDALPRWFRRVPVTDVVLVPFPVYQQPTAPGGQYLAAAEDGSRPATYFYRTSQPVRRVGLEGTVFHEIWPGHHLQIATNSERRGAHPITRLVSVSGFTEGWASYAERLAEEMGIYGSERDRLGAYLTLAPLMAVDLGVQLRGWSVARARRYLEIHAPNLPRERVPVVVGLLASLPGFVASYTVGEMEIAGLRRGAERALGPRFDIRAFHEVLLEDGAVPLPLLEDKVRRWIAAQGGPT